MKSLLTIAFLCSVCVLTGLARQQSRALVSPQNSGQKPAPTPPQEPETDVDVVKITTNLVQVDAVVLDKNGRPVADLRPDEIEVLEDGKVRTLTHFSYVNLNSRLSDRVEASNTPSDRKASPVPAPPVKLRPEDVHRTIALVVDDLGLSFESAYYVRQALRKFVDEQMQPHDLVAIIKTGGGIGALQQFTSNKQQLYAAVEKVKWNPQGRGGVGAFAPIGSDEEISVPLDGERIPGQPKNDLDQFREDFFAVGTLGALNYVVGGLSELPGRKSIILFSDGLKIITPNDPEGNVRILKALRYLTDLANRASVVIYSMDARGLQTLGMTAADSTSGMSFQQVEQKLSDRRTTFFESQNGLNYLSERTGGMAIFNSNDLSAGIRRIIDDQGGYYLIGYRPDDTTFELVKGKNKFHSISLRVKRPGKFTVRMRNGFYGVTDKAKNETPKSPQQQLVGALTSPFGSAQVHLRLTSLFANGAREGSTMKSFLHINTRDLTFTDQPDGWHQAVFEIIAVTFGDNGTVVDQFSRQHTIRLRGNQYDNAMKGGLTYNMVVPVKNPGAYQLRAALRDEASGRVGSAAQFIEVPDIKKNRLVVGGILMQGVPLEAYLKAVNAPSVAESADDTTDDSASTANSAVRQFRTGQALIYGFTIYNARVDKTSGKPKLTTQVRVFRNGQQIFIGNEIPFDPGSQADLRRVVAGGAIQLGTDMVPGEYVMQVVVTDLSVKDKRRVATQWMDFEITK